MNSKIYSFIIFTLLIFTVILIPANSNEIKYLSKENNQIDS